MRFHIIKNKIAVQSTGKLPGKIKPIRQSSHPITLFPGHQCFWQLLCSCIIVEELPALPSLDLPFLASICSRVSTTSIIDGRLLGSPARHLRSIKLCCALGRVESSARRPDSISSNTTPKPYTSLLTYRWPEICKENSFLVALFSSAKVKTLRFAASRILPSENPSLSLKLSYVLSLKLESLVVKVLAAVAVEVPGMKETFIFDFTFILPLFNFKPSLTLHDMIQLNLT
ncbi:hypothetical protein M5K25_027066 [Dendrobium thyrsiflorum]|uniref:Uncharacterized protein n=1 Tax=Dendrobium thyrsiflorum TaxID=117978 RepID=A0ABD0TZE1_DENTH